MQAGILLSRLAGLIRERVIAAHLGTGPAVEAFRAAVRIPNVLQNLLGEGVLSASFIPVHARLLGEGRERDAARLAGAVAGILTLLAGVGALVGIVAAGPLTDLLAPGFTGERRDLTVRLVRIVSPGVALLVLSAWCLGVLNSHRRFFISYVAPVFWNAAQIAAVVTAAALGATDAGLATALAWGVVAGGAAQLAVQLPGVLRVSGGIRWSLDRRVPGVGTTFRRLGTVVMGRGVVQIVSYLDLLIASLLAAGGVAALTFAQVFHLLPLSLFGMAVAAAELPELSRGDAGDDHLRRLEDAAATVAFWVVPCAAAYLVAGDVVVGALLQTGAFRASDTLLVWWVLAPLAASLPAGATGRLLQNACYAVGDVRGPARLAALRVAVSTVVGALAAFEADRLVLAGGLPAGFSHLPVVPLPLPADVRAAGDAVRLGAVGLTTGAAVGAWLEYVLLRRRLRRDHGTTVGLGGGRLRAVLAATAPAVAVMVGLRAITGGLPPPVAAVAVIGPAAAAYLGTATLVGLDPLRRIGLRPGPATGG